MGRYLPTIAAVMKNRTGRLGCREWWAIWVA